jgi:superfamily II DNA or RNA helicase
MSAVLRYQPGSLVSARGREWIVLPQSTADTLHLRPLGSAEEDATVLYLPLERRPVAHASFPLPQPSALGNQSAGLLLRDALLLKLRNGAGPFRSFGNIAFEPRAYQLVPLLMALKLPTVRLLVADDVGIGKTIEAGLIARELLDRGEISRLAVLCPPHLCDQWQDELASKFHIRAEKVHTSTAGRLERGLPANTSIFDAYPYTVVSLDYIKSDRRRDEFQRACPECVIVDEAHTCAQGAQVRHQRFRLLKGLAENAARHMILLTATPHSGDDEAFYNLLGLLHSDFVGIKDLPQDERHPLRERLAQHFVQRRRKDIDEWQEARGFPDRRTAEIIYRLTGKWGKLFEDVLTYARELVSRSASETRQRQRMSWWAALALLRCVSSSPAAAVMALRTRLENPLKREGANEALSELELETLGRERVLDGVEGALSEDDIEPGARVEDTKRLETLIEAAEGLVGEKNDPKLAMLSQHLEELLSAGFRPVVFCRYIATAHYVAGHLNAKFVKHRVIAVTGELAPGEREEAVGELREHDKRILVATDCLSEGINLQSLFDAIVHYDLSWNPTRHEQREGRVDRFGQTAKEVRATMLYGADNPVDGAVLQVILRKAESIRKELGVLVPVPEDDGQLTEALMNAVLMRKGTIESGQKLLDFGEAVERAEVVWQSAREKAARNRTIFAQRRLKPEDVLPEWKKTLDALGSHDDVERFVNRALVKLNAPLDPAHRQQRLLVEHVPAAVRERLHAEGLSGTVGISFRFPPENDALFVHRTHPLVAGLADYLIEHALAGDADDLVARSGAIFTAAVKVRTTVLLLRVRHQLTVTVRREERLHLCEESVTLAVQAGDQPQLLATDAARALLDAEPARNMPGALRERHIRDALEALPAWQPMIEAAAQSRAATLLEDHRRVREASGATGSFAVKPNLPVDVIGLYVLVPAQGG